MKRVLIVAGHNAFRETLAQTLKWGGFEEVSEAESAAEGRRLLATLRGSIDVAVVELDLPDEEGTELVKEMCEAESEMSILVLALAPESEVHEQLREMGVKEVLAKAISGEELVAAIRRLGSE
jgi:DNA-binding NarL/FixJ family response regulator